MAFSWPVAIVIVTCLSPCLHAEDLASTVRRAIDLSTLDQAGTKPFHLKAHFALSRDPEKDPSHSGQIEVWWESPRQWRRELQTPSFHQTMIQNGDQVWQSNDSDYFPDWLRQLAVAILRPVPFSTDELLKRVGGGEVKHLFGQTNVSWEQDNQPGDQQVHGKGYIAIHDAAGDIFYTGGPGFGGLYKDFKSFHDRSVARTVSSGYEEVTAHVDTLEDLAPPSAGLFDGARIGASNHVLDTVFLTEDGLRANLVTPQSPTWPAVQNGPFEGVVWTDVVLDASGKIREMHTPISDNPALISAADQYFRSLQFRPFLINGNPVQASGRVSIRFKTSRPVGAENFSSARDYFDKGRKASYLAAGSTSPYHLSAEFELGTKDGVKTGKYEDTWLSPTEWKREAWFLDSRVVRSRVGDQQYRLEEGGSSKVLELMMQLMEPIPALDTMTESDWRIRKDTLNGVETIRVARGSEGPNGELDAGHSNVYWFDPSNTLVRAYLSGFEVEFRSQRPFGGVLCARQIAVLKDGKVATILNVKDIVAVDSAPVGTFKVKGHEWNRAFTAEER